MTEILLSSGALDALPQFCENQKSVVVCDELTLEVAGKSICESLQPNATLINLGKRPEPSVALCETLLPQVSDCDLLIAVGSGSINDITKYIAHKSGKPYICVATAPSMNGYLSPTASLLDGLFKRSFSATAPTALIADLHVLSAAPLKMIKAGIGDTLCRSSIEADMILAHHLTGTPYQAEWFSALQEKEKELLSFNGDLHQREAGFIRALVESLLIGGQMMKEHGSSATCSQGEHMIIHTYDLLYKIPHTVLHGEGISVATVSMAKLQHKLLKRPPRLRPIADASKELNRAFGKRLGEKALEEFQSKQLTQQQCDTLQEKMHELWPQLRTQIEERVINTSSLERRLKKFKCPTHYQDLLWSRDRYEAAITKAYLTRDRFTFLDIAAMDKTLRYEI